MGTPVGSSKEELQERSGSWKQDNITKLKKREESPDTSLYAVLQECTEMRGTRTA